MESVPITVMIAVGPLPHHRQWLGEAIASAQCQVPAPGEIFLVDDYARLPFMDGCTVHQNPWRLGYPASANIGVALARHDLVVFLSSDDRLLPGCLEHCWAEWERQQDYQGYYWLDVQYSDGEIQAVACNAAMAHRGLWLLTGGFPPESAVGAPDSILLTMMLGANGAAGRFYHVQAGYPLYWSRHHAQQETETHGYGSEWGDAIRATRDILTRTWQIPKWT